MRGRLGLPQDPRVRVIGQISRIIPSKGQGRLLTAARSVLAKEPETAFLICGYPQDPAYQAWLEREAVTLGIADRVRIIRYPGPIGDVWAAIDIHVHASLADSSPMAIAEGMALAKPAVVTRVGGIPELVEHGRTGLVVPAGDSEALAGALLRLLREPETARRLGTAAHERYRLRHRPESMARSLEEIFSRVAQGRERRRAEGGPAFAQRWRKPKDVPN
jgi:glycosyltransferase involved in cell wall biosynthesis